MTIDAFWRIVDSVHLASGGDMDKKCALLEKELRKLKLEEVVSFHGHFNDCMISAYSWPLWGAAYIMGGGCSDDGFMDFRSTLVSMGRATFESALRDPETLGKLELETGKEMQFEGYEYVPTEVGEALNGGRDLPHPRPHPAEPSGEAWEESALAGLFPKLAEKYGFTI